MRLVPIRLPVVAMQGKRFPRLFNPRATDFFLSRQDRSIHTRESDYSPNIAYLKVPSIASKRKTASKKLNKNSGTIAAFRPPAIYIYLQNTGVFHSHSYTSLVINIKLCSTNDAQ